MGDQSSIRGTYMDRLYEHLSIEEEIEILEEYAKYENGVEEDTSILDEE